MRGLRAQQRLATEIAEGGADAHPFDLLVRLAHAQLRVLAVEIDEIELAG